MTKPEHINYTNTLSMMDCICDLWTRSPYSREDHCSGEIRRPASMAMWTIWASCSLLRASYVRNSSFSCISEESSSRLVTWQGGQTIMAGERIRKGSNWERWDKDEKEQACMNRLLPRYRTNWRIISQSLTSPQNETSLPLVHTVHDT